MPPAAPAHRNGPTLSVVAPLYNECENVRPLVDWILQALESYPLEFEIILVDDGSRDETWNQVRAAAADPRVHGLRLGRNVGQTAAMMAGFDHARGDVIVSLDGDLQNDPRDIPALVAKLRGRVRPGVRMAAPAAGQAAAPEGAVVGGQPADPAAHRCSHHGQRLFPQGLSP